MKKLKGFINRLRKTWFLARRIRIVRNYMLEVDEIWCETTKEANRGICAGYCTIATIKNKILTPEALN